MKNPKVNETLFRSMSTREIEDVRQIATTIGFPASRWRDFMVWIVRMQMRDWRNTGRIVYTLSDLPLHSGNSRWAAIAPDGTVLFDTLAQTRKACRAKTPSMPGIRFDRIRAIPQFDFGRAAFMARQNYLRRSRGRPAGKPANA